MKRRTFYDALGLDPAATQDEIEARFRELARTHRPDRSVSEAWMEIAQAYSTLHDPGKRAGYDAHEFRHGLWTVTCVNEASLPEVTSHLTYWCFCILRLDGTAVCDRRSLITQAYHDLPNPYGYTQGDNWDTFLDVVSDGLSELPQKRITIVWTDVQNMLVGGLPDLLTAYSVFEDLAERLSAATTAERKHLITLFAGTGANFPAIPR